MQENLVTSPPVVMAPRVDGFEVLWGVARLSRGWLEWESPDGSTGRYCADAFGMVPQDEKVLRVRVDGWAGGETRRVRAVTEAVMGPETRHESPWKSVRTLDPTADTAHFAVWNDTHQNNSTVRALHAATPEVDLLVWNGDLCNDWKDQHAFVSTILSPAGQDVSAGRPLSIVVGNHDVRGTWAFQLEDYVAAPQGRPFSAFRCGPVAVVVLHTGEDKPDSHPSFEGRVAFEPLRAEQAHWLREVTARPEIRDAPYKVVFCHIPLRWIEEEEVDYASGGYDWFSRMSRDAWHEALTEWGAQIVISGHTHLPAWLPPSPDFPYGQLVAGGPDDDPDAEEAATWVEGTATPQALHLTMRTLDGGVLHDLRIEPSNGPTEVNAV
ncbi:metallophosphoesterase [Arthrobacter sp. GMC3]|uniref:metallophosphoesterase family protein n=1 Tax=Arthrobacter sp. GMC3 TaxID=2058894 RepID=UPI0015E42CA9|nr:metallophosphoesterase [Arthrobacter sp. GMC3]